MTAPIEPGSRCAHESAKGYDERAREKRRNARDIRATAPNDSQNYGRWQLTMAEVYDCEAELFDAVAQRLRQFVETEKEQQ